MMNLCNYQILQRNQLGFAAATFEGNWKNTNGQTVPVFARVVREADNLTVIQWKKCECTADKWFVTLDIPEGGLYRIEASTGTGWNDRIKVVYHVGVGDIYVTAGQSNTTGYGRDNAFDPPALGVHAFANNGSWCIATHPLSDAVDTIFPFPENATGTSPALSFARKLSRELNIPIGIVPTAVGGTPLSAWNPDQSGECFASMCKRFEYIGDFKGFIWIQGCSDCEPNLAETYYDRFKRMKELWDEKLGVHPIVTAQLNRVVCPDNEPIQAHRCWGIVRDAQRRAALDIDDVYVVPSLDLPTTDGIHNGSGSNVILGERMANAALKYIYNKPGQIAPCITSAKMIDETHIFVKIADATNIVTMNNIAQGMNIEDSDGIIDCLSVSAQPDGVIVEASRPFALPAKYHYAWKKQPPMFIIRDYLDMPLLACYGVEIEDMANEN